MPRMVLPSFLLGFVFVVSFWSSSSPRVDGGFVRVIFGTPYLYIPQKFEVNPGAPQINGPAYQRTHGYRANVYLDNINQKTIEGNPRIYDVEDSTRRYNSVLPNLH